MCAACRLSGTDVYNFKTLQLQKVFAFGQVVVMHSHMCLHCKYKVFESQTSCQTGWRDTSELLPEICDNLT